jgi:peptide/nickel transport system permease protein
MWHSAWIRIRKDPAALLCLGVVLVYALVAIIAPLVFSGWQMAHDYAMTNRPPSWRHLLGTDAMGRSVLIKTLLSAHVSMTVGFVANAIAIPLGMFLGALAGYFGRRVDDVIVWLYTTLASIPGIILLIAIKFAFQGKVLFEGTWVQLDLGGMAGLCIALGVTSWINTCRLVRAETMKIKELDYVTAARASGKRGIGILFSHVFPNVSHIGIINFSLGFVSAIIAEVTLSYLNLGVMDLPSWGKMINAARMELVVGHWWEFTAAVVATFIIVLAWNILGDRLRDALDPSLKNVQ